MNEYGKINLIHQNSVNYAVSMPRKGRKLSKMYDIFQRPVSKVFYYVALLMCCILFLDFVEIVRNDLHSNIFNIRI